MDPACELLRHAVATVAYRGAKAVHAVAPDFAAFRPAGTARTPGEILAHIGDLFDWARSLAAGEQVWHDSAPLPWVEEVERFFRSLAAFDACLASEQPLGSAPEKLLQGPIADALTHIGQIAMLRRLAGSPMRGESYFKADIRAGRVGPDQATPSREFD